MLEIVEMLPTPLRRRGSQKIGERGHGQHLIDAQEKPREGDDAWCLVNQDRRVGGSARTWACGLDHFAKRDTVGACPEDEAAVGASAGSDELGADQASHDL